MRIILISFIVFVSIQITAQTTVGVLSMNEDVSEGYTFFSPFSGTKAYMIDNCGRLVNEWDRGTRPGLSAYFLDSGLMLRTYKIAPEGPYTSASNAGGIELVDWYNNTVWKYEINTSEQLSHHDAVMMPNGNILILTWELTYRDELVELGRDPNEIAVENYMWSEKILELKPIGSDSAEIVWQWHINDHYIQDFDPSKEGFGVVSDHPELFDINQPDLNSGNSNETRDWNHFNSIDYNEQLDQILISVRNSDEIWILDHSTTTEEAATHSGGRYGKGGDILYRWGNPSAYKLAPIDDQLLWGQHGVNWIADDLEDGGKILIYNNGNGKPGTDFSQIQILDPPQDSLGFYRREANEAYGPSELETVYGDLNNETFYSAYLSNAQRLESGNTLINAGSPGRIFEIDADRNIVWAYEIPLFGDFPATQGQNVNNNGNFRAYKYPPDYPGFDGVDLTPGLPIEFDPNDCELMTDINDPEIPDYSVRYLDYSSQLEIKGEISRIAGIEVYDISGRLVERFNYVTKLLDLKDTYMPGIYIISIQLKDNQRLSFNFLSF